jgi:bacterioferritin
MDKPRLVAKFNEAIAVELQAVIQYNHNAQVLMGRDRRIWEKVFKEMAEHGLEHSRKFGQRVVALGGIPTIEPAPVVQATSADEMLRNALALEQRLVQLYTEALEFCKDSPAYRNLLEDQILDEVTDCEELEKYMGQVQKLASAQGGQQRSQTA